MRPAVLVVVGVLLAATVASVVVSDRLVDAAEAALLEQRTREGAMVLQSVADGLELPLQAAVSVSGMDDDGQQDFRTTMSPLLAPSGPFDGAVLVAAGGRVLEAVGPVGLRLPDRRLRELSEEARAAPGRAAAAMVRDGGQRTLALAVAVPPAQGSHLVVAEVVLGDGSPIDRSEEAFEEVDFALYMGRSEDVDSVLLRSTDELPLQGQRASEPVWLGTEELVLVMTPRRPLLGGIADNLPWIVAGTGLCVTLAAGVVVGGVVRRREEALGRSEALEREVQARTAQLSSANQELEAFAYSVSHDLRAPLRAIDGFTMAVLDDHPRSLPAAARSDLQRVRRASQRMGAIIDDLLTLSRVTRQPMRVELVDLSSEAREVLRRLEEADPERSVTTLVTDDLVVRGDPRLLRLLLENLLQNAWKFTAREPSARIELGRRAAAGEPVFFVRDNGVGFDPSYGDKLFQPFQRLHGADEFEGTGIGLATAARVVSRHGGRVWAEGEVGRGATIYFTCPSGEGGS